MGIQHLAAAPAVHQLVAGVRLHDPGVDVVVPHDFQDLLPPGPGSSASIGKTSSTRRSRLRCIQSALPIQMRGLPPHSNLKIRLCSRSWPTIEWTVIFSERPGTPGIRQQMPPDDQLDRDARLGGLVKKLDDVGVDQRVDLRRDAGGQALGGGGNLPFDHLLEEGAHVDRGGDKPVVAGRAGIAGQDVERGSWRRCRRAPCKS